MTISVLLTILMTAFPSTVGAEDWLRLGNHELNSGRYDTAVVSFERALKTGHLNLPGRVYVYWNLFNCARKSKEFLKEAPEYLFGFIITAEDLEDIKDDNPSLSLFYNVQNIKERLSDARCMLNHYWENRDARIFSGCPK